MGKFRKNAGLLIILSVMITSFFTSCNGKPGIMTKSPDINIPFETEFELQSMTDDKFEVEGSMKRLGTGLWEMSITSPETLAGLSITYNDDGVKAELNGLTLDVPMEDIRSGAIFSLIFKAIDSAAATDLNCTETENGKVCIGDFADGTYTLTFDEESLLPEELDIPSANISIEFENFRETNNNSVTTTEAKETGSES